VAIKILILQDNLINESLAVCELAGVLKSRGYLYDILVEKEECHFVKKVIGHQPDLIIIPISIISSSWGIALIEELRPLLPQSLILAGGTFPAFYPDFIQHSSADFILAGEAEEAILDLLLKLESNQDYTNIENLYVKIKGKIFKNKLGNVVSYCDFAIPDRDLYYNRYPVLRNFGLKTFSSGRGCPNSCSYCFNPTLKERSGKPEFFTRKKPINKLIAEIKVIKDKHYPMTHIHFSDDLFTFDKKWVQEFCVEYKKNFDIPFTINSKVEYLDEEMLIQLKLSGCRGIAIGVESGNEKLRIKTLNKQTSNASVVNICSLIKKHKLVLTTFNILNLPGESLEDMLETVKFNQILKADNPRVGIFHAIPGTELYQSAYSLKLIDGDLDELLIQGAKDLRGTKYYLEAKIICNIFPLLVSFPMLLGAIKKFKFVLRNPLLQLISVPLSFAKLFYERKFFKVSLIKSVPFYLHTGGPAKKTTIYSSIL